MTNEVSPPFLSVREAAAALGVSPDVVRRRCYDGTLPFRQIGRRGRISVCADALLALGVDPTAIKRRRP